MTVCKMIHHTKSAFGYNVENFATDLENKINNIIAAMEADGYKFINSTNFMISQNSVIVYLYFDKK